MAKKEKRKKIFLKEKIKQKQVRIVFYVISEKLYLKRKKTTCLLKKKKKNF